MDHGHSTHAGATVVVHTGGLNWATEKNVVEHVLGRRPGVISVEANPVAQTATVTFDPQSTSITDLQSWIRECGLHCAGRSVPNHICDPMEEVTAEERPAAEHARHAVETMPTPHEMMGHGGHAEMSMERMVRDMRNRFAVAVIFSGPILLWSSLGRQVLGFTAPAPFGLRDDVFQLLLSSVRQDGPPRDRDRSHRPATPSTLRGRVCPFA